MSIACATPSAVSPAPSGKGTASFQSLLDSVVEFASSGPWDGELRSAREEYVTQTGELFESDASFERRIGAFLEWYALDREVTFAPRCTPLQLYMRTLDPHADSDHYLRLCAWTKTLLSLFAWEGEKKDQIHLRDLLSGTRYRVRKPKSALILDEGDVLEGRLVVKDEAFELSENFAVLPKGGRKLLDKALAAFAKRAVSGAERLAFVHRVAYLANRCERYRHVDPQRIFAELMASV